MEHKKQRKGLFKKSKSPGEMRKDSFDEIYAYLLKRKLEIIFPEDNALQYYLNEKRRLRKKRTMAVIYLHLHCSNEKK